MRYANDDAVPRRPEDLDAQDGGATRIYFVPQREGQAAPCYLFEMPAGQKAYVRMWLDEVHRLTEWTWTLPDHAILLWEES